MASLTVEGLFLALVVGLVGCAAVASLAESLYTRRPLAALAALVVLAGVGALVANLHDVALLWAPLAGQETA